MLVSAIQQCESATGIYMSPPSWASLLSPPHPTPLGHHGAQSWAPCIVQQLPTSYLFQQQYMFQCYSLNSSQPLLPPLCPHVCSLCLRLCSCPANQFTSNHSSIFHIFTCINIQYLFFSFWLTYFLALGSSTSIQLTQIHSFLWLGNIPLYIVYSLPIHLLLDIYIAFMSWLL